MSHTPADFWDSPLARRAAMTRRQAAVQLLHGGLRLEDVLDRLVAFAGDLDPDGRWVTISGQHMHLDGTGQIEAGGHPELRKVLAEKSGLHAKAAATAKAPADGRPDVAKLKLPPVGSTVTVGGSKYQVEPLDGDDSFPPAIASYAAKYGHLFYQGRNGSEGVVSGPAEAVAQWMKQVDKAVKEHSPAAAAVRDWQPSDGGGELITRARESAHAAADTFGLLRPNVRFLSRQSSHGQGGEAGHGSVSVVNAHEDRPSSFFFAAPGVTSGMHMAAHEVGHQAYSANAELSHEIAGRAWKLGPLSHYGSLSGAFENVMELAAAFVTAPEALKKHSKPLYDLADEWARRSRKQSSEATMSRPVSDFWSAAVTFSGRTLSRRDLASDLLASGWSLSAVVDRLQAATFAGDGQGDLDPDGRWITISGQHMHLDGTGQIEAGGHPELRKVLAEKAGLTSKGDAGAAKPKGPAISYRSEHFSESQASSGMTSWLQKNIDMEEVEKHGSTNPLDGVGAVGKQVAFPIQGRLYVVDRGQDGKKFFEEIREVPAEAVEYPKSTPGGGGKPSSHSSPYQGPTHADTLADINKGASSAESKSLQAMHDWLKSPERKSLTLAAGDKAVRKQDQAFRSEVYKHRVERLKGPTADATSRLKTPQPPALDFAMAFGKLPAGAVVTSPEGRLAQVQSVPEYGHTANTSHKIVNRRNALQWLDTGEVDEIHKGSGVTADSVRWVEPLDPKLSLRKPPEYKPPKPTDMDEYYDSLEKKKKAATAKPATHVEVGGNTFTHKDKIKAAGGKWDPASKTWRIHKDKVHVLHELKGLHFDGAPPPAAGLSSGMNPEDSLDVHAAQVYFDGAPTAVPEVLARLQGAGLSPHWVATCMASLDVV